MKYITKALFNCKDLDPTGKYVFVSDMHLGCKDNADETLNVQHLIFYALKWYLNNDYTVICLGDTFELAETPDIEKIKNAHDDIMWLLSELHNRNRLVMVKGNHEEFLRPKHLYDRESQYDGSRIPFLPDVKLYDSVMIGTKVYAMHGNQDSWKFCSWFNKVLVKLGGIWKWWQLHCKDFHVSEATGWQEAESTQLSFNSAGISRGVHFIIGHTHKCSFEMSHLTDAGTFGCMPRCITCVEVLSLLSDDGIQTCKWSEVAEDDGTLKIQKTLLGTQRCL